VDPRGCGGRKYRIREEVGLEVATLWSPLDVSWERHEGLGCVTIQSLNYGENVTFLASSLTMAAHNLLSVRINIFISVTKQIWSSRINCIGGWSSIIIRKLNHRLWGFEPFFFKNVRIWTMWIQPHNVSEISSLPNDELDVNWTFLPGCCSCLVGNAFQSSTMHHVLDTWYNPRSISVFGETMTSTHTCSTYMASSGINKLDGEAWSGMKSMLLTNCHGRLHLPDKGCLMQGRRSADGFISWLCSYTPFFSEKVIGLIFLYLVSSTPSN
jgi:hypothetical protein